MVIPTLKTCYFVVSEDIMTKFESQALHIIRIKHWKASGSGKPPFLIHVLRKIAIFGLKTKFYALFLHKTVSHNVSMLEEKRGRPLLIHTTLEYICCLFWSIIHVCTLRDAQRCFFDRYYLVTIWSSPHAIGNYILPLKCIFGIG